MQLNINGLAVVVEDDQIANLLQMHLRGDAANTPRGYVDIGDVWPEHGGVYAGIARGRDGSADYHLLIGPELDGDGMTWQDAARRVEALDHNGFSDWTLPSLKEQSLILANVPELLQQSWYWSCNQHHRNEYAWYQSFIDGYQLSCIKDNKLRARAVRRSPI